MVVCTPAEVRDPGMNCYDLELKLPRGKIRTGMGVLPNRVPTRRIDCLPPSESFLSVHSVVSAYV